MYKYFKSEKHQLVIFVPNFQTGLLEAKIKCMETEGNSECVLKNHFTGSNEIVEIANQKWSLGRTTAIENVNFHNYTVDILKQRESFTRAASIDDLKRSILLTHYTQTVWESKIPEDKTLTNLLSGNIYEDKNINNNSLEEKTENEETYFTKCFNCGRKGHIAKLCKQKF